MRAALALCRWAAPLALAALTACALLSLTFDASTIGGPDSGKTGEVFLPAGSGPFPAVVVLHGCGGVDAHHRRWARRLASAGYVALVIDSFRPRGVGNMCTSLRTIPAETRAGDAYAAADYLRKRADVVPGAIGVIGFSHGGWTIMKAVATDHAQPFAAAVAFYPYCEPPTAPLATDLLILDGDADDWTPSDLCGRWQSTVERAGHTLELKVYPGAGHGFDREGPPSMSAGHLLVRQPAAAEDAVARTAAFFAARLKR